MEAEFEEKLEALEAKHAARVKELEEDAEVCDPLW